MRIKVSIRNLRAEERAEEEKTEKMAAENVKKPKKPADTVAVPVVEDKK